MAGASEGFVGSSSYADDVLLTKLLRSAGIQKPETCGLLLEILESARSKDSERRLIGSYQIRQCLKNLHMTRESQAYVHVAAFVIERGAVQAIASGMREVLTGNWEHLLVEKSLDLSSKSARKITVNKALIYSQCLASLAAVDNRCVAFILKEFPDVAKIASGMLLEEPSTEEVSHHKACRLRRQAGAELTKMLMNLMAGSESFTKIDAANTALLKGILTYAASIKDVDEATSRAEAESYFIALGIVQNAAFTQKVDLRALKRDLYELVEHVLANAKSRVQIDMAIQLLFMTANADLEENCISEYPSLGSSILALLSLGDRIGEFARDLVNCAANDFWKKEIQTVQGGQMATLDVSERFKDDKKAVQRAIQLCRVYSTSAAPQDICEAFHIERRRNKQDKDQRSSEERRKFATLPFRARLERRTCSNIGCGNTESVAGQFQVCGRCKLAVYCSKDCQKRAWKEGHKDLCH
ncbi:hypothetical protein KFL_000280120 [Klebsormidium nitens]|uniref:MYND-type domain-containing protein n=1 Tax=Klebsormidium nitens TaxID=105231 RepID=A0A1Y1HRW0_KLENI|nr:hypothetical protein KFL_000280120 [Klebsormidium nitens]|eukprot:GAQ79307.1 hypothetical protein KFL_000280120 [Klebsormidium nitens]